MNNEAVFDALIEGCDAFKEEFAAEFQSRAAARTPRVTGALLNSLYSEVTPTGFEVGYTVSYAPFVEYGTTNMAPRAMLRTTAAEAEQIAEIASRKAGLK